MKIEERIPGDYVFVDGSLVGEVGPTVMRQRDELAQSGFVTAIARYDRQAGKTVGQPRIITQWLCLHPRCAGSAIPGWRSRLAPLRQVKRGTAPGKVEEKVERALSSLFYRETKRKPVVTVALTEV